MSPGVRRRAYLAAALASLLLAGCGSHKHASFSPGGLCKRSAFLPAPVPFPSGFPAFSFFRLKPSANAAAHHTLCRVAISTPGTQPKYEYDVAWYVFATHGEAVADFKAFQPRSIYSRIESKRSAAGFPRPNVVLQAVQQGSRTIVVSFVEGDAVASGYVYGGGTSAQATVLARWALDDLRHLEAQ